MQNYCDFSFLILFRSSKFVADSIHFLFDQHKIKAIVVDKEVVCMPVEYRRM